MGLRARTSHGGGEVDRHQLLGQIAAWYYDDGLDQGEIARRIGKSRSMVSRMLAEARAEGIVQIRVRFPLRTRASLEDELTSLFGLSEAHVLEGHGLDNDEMLRRLGQLGAVALESRLQSGIHVTVGWGAALYSVVRALPEIQLENVMVLQAMGSVGDGDPKVDGAELARTLASKLNGDFRALAAPLIVDREEVAASLLAERTIAATLDLASRADIAITGIGSIDTALSGLVRAGYFGPDHIARLKAAGIVGDLLGFLVGEDGAILDVPENRRVVALRPDKLGRSVIGVAGGASKAGAILAALRGGHIDVLVTDSAAAESIVWMHRRAAPDLVEV